MRLTAAPLGLAVLSACSVPNPAYFATQGASDGSSSPTTATTSAGTVGPTTTVATVEPGTTDAPPTSTSVTSSPTTATSSTTEPVDPSTSASMTATSTTLTTDSTSTSTGGPDSTSTGEPDTMGGFLPMLDMGVIGLCEQLVAPDLALSIQHDPAPETCTMPAFGPSFHGVFKGKADADSLVFRQCKDLPQCMAGNLDCLEEQTVTIHFTGPATHVPAFEVGACVNISYIGTGYAAPDACQAKIVRLAQTGQNIKTTSVYVGAVGLPDTSLLPAPWPNILEFSVHPSLLAPCGEPDEQICGQGSGDYELAATFSGMQYKVPSKTEKPVKLPLYDPQNVKIGDVIGTFYNLRSWAHPIEECEFKWIWLASEYKP